MLSLIFVFLFPGLRIRLLEEEEEEEGLTVSLSDCLSSLSVGEWDDDVLSDLWHFKLSFLWNLRTTSSGFSFPSLLTFTAAGQTYKPVVICEIGDLNKEVLSVHTSPCVVNFSALQWQQVESLFISFQRNHVFSCYTRGKAWAQLLKGFLQSLTFKQMLSPDMKYKWCFKHFFTMPGM